MFKFSDYLIEMAAASSSESSDDKGKMHELLLAKYLNPNKDEYGEQVLPLHHRSESEEYGGTPKQVHDRLRMKINPAAYNEINSHAKQTAFGVLKHLKKSGFNNNHLSDIHWTSNRDTAKKGGDHEKTTGIRDTNSNADLILTYQHPKTKQKTFVGVSAKYGTNQEPNYRNDGLDNLEKKYNIPSGTLTNIQKIHDKDMTDRLGYTGSRADKHIQYKIGRKIKEQEKAAHKAAGGDNNNFQPISYEAKRASDAENASIESRRKMARAMDAGLSTMNDSQLRELIRGQVSPKTKIHHIVAHSHVQDDGTAISKIGDMHNIADEHLNNFKNLRVKKGNGIYSQIVGDYNGKERPVAQQLLKTVSGPVKGTAGAFKLVSLPKKKTTKSDKITNSGEWGGAPFNATEETDS